VMERIVMTGRRAGGARRLARMLGWVPIALAAACGEPNDRPGRVEAARAAPPAVSEPLSVQYLGNEGFLVRAGDDAVILDGLVRGGIPPYVRLPDAARAGLEAAEPPFDDIDVALASHFHSDHFDDGSRGVDRFTRSASLIHAGQLAFLDYPLHGYIRRVTEVHEPIFFSLT